MNNIKKQIEKEINSFIPKIKCEICGKEEIRKSSNHKFCESCKNKSRILRSRKYNKQNYLKSLFESGNKLIKEFSCKECGIKFYEYKIKRTKRYCSNECKYKSQAKRKRKRGKTYIKIKCATCGGIVKTYSWAGTRFCSRICYEIDHKKNWSFPHKGKKIEEWMFKGNQLKLKKHRENLKKKMLEFYKNHPEKTNKGKSLIEIYGKERAKEISKLISKRTKESWKIPENRKKWLKTNGRFKKGQKSWNTGIKPTEEIINKSRRTKEQNYLKKIGIKL